MNYPLKIRKLGKAPKHRWIMLRNMACSLIKHERIETTGAKSLQLKYLMERVFKVLYSNNKSSNQVIKDKKFLKQVFFCPGAYSKLLYNIKPRLEQFKYGNEFSRVYSRTRYSSNAKLYTVELAKNPMKRFEEKRLFYLDKYLNNSYFDWEYALRKEQLNDLFTLHLLLTDMLKICYKLMLNTKIKFNLDINYYNSKNKNDLNNLTMFSNIKFSNNSDYDYKSYNTNFRYEKIKNEIDAIKNQIINIIEKSYKIINFSHSHEENDRYQLNDKRNNEFEEENNKVNNEKLFNIKEFMIKKVLSISLIEEVPTNVIEFLKVFEDDLAKINKDININKANLTKMENIKNNIFNNYKQLSEYNKKYYNLYYKNEIDEFNDKYNEAYKEISNSKKGIINLIDKLKAKEDETKLLIKKMNKIRINKPEEIIHIDRITKIKNKKEIRKENAYKEIKNSYYKNYITGEESGFSGLEELENKPNELISLKRKFNSAFVSSLKKNRKYI